MQKSLRKEDDKENPKKNWY